MRTIGLKNSFARLLAIVLDEQGGREETRSSGAEIELQGLSDGVEQFSLFGVVLRVEEFEEDVSVLEPDHPLTL